MLPDRLPITTVPDGLPAFVDGVLLATLTSDSKSITWCAEWRQHPDAVTRLAAIWDAWTHLLAEEDAQLHSFLRDVLDHHMPKLLDKEVGPFASCQYEHKPHKRLDASRAATST